jgi:hypothetical protein
MDYSGKSFSLMTSTPTMRSLGRSISNTHDSEDADADPECDRKLEVSFLHGEEFRSSETYDVDLDIQLPGKAVSGWYPHAEGRVATRTVGNPVLFNEEGIGFESAPIVSATDLDIELPLGAPMEGPLNTGSEVENEFRDISGKLDLGVLNRISFTVVLQLYDKTDVTPEMELVFGRNS